MSSRWLEPLRRSIRLIKEKISADKEVFRGVDMYGNTFYELEKSKRRFYVPKSANSSKMSPEWRGWLSFKRQDPPTEAEVNRNFQALQIRKIKAELREDPADCEKLGSEGPVKGYDPKFKDIKIKS